MDGDDDEAQPQAHGQKVGWALGAMLYEINTMPWEYAREKDNFLEEAAKGHIRVASELALLAALAFGVILSLLILFVRRERNLRHMYEPIKDVHHSISV